MTPEDLVQKRKLRGQQLKKLRIEKNVSQNELVVRSGLAWPTITRIENGTAGWSIDSELLYLDGLSKASPSRRKLFNRD